MLGAQQDESVARDHAPKLFEHVVDTHQFESLRAMLPSLADCAELNALADKVEEEKRAAQTAKPLSVKARHLEARVAHKRRTQASA